MSTGTARRKASRPPATPASQPAPLSPPPPAAPRPRPPSPPASGRRRDTTARTATTDMSQDTTTTGVKRREFLKVLGASGAALAAAGCSEPTGKLIPYLVSPDETVPGVSTYYATTCRECSAGCGMIAETRDGRAIKLE